MVISFQSSRWRWLGGLALSAVLCGGGLAESGVLWLAASPVRDSGPDSAAPSNGPTIQTAPPDRALPPVDYDGEVRIPQERLDWHIPDPEFGRAGAGRALDEARRKNDRPTITYITRLLERLDTIRRAEQLHLTLEDCLHRALSNSYAIEVERYNPAVETTRVVEAQAAFDAVFFTDIQKNKVDRPTGSQLASSDLDYFDSNYGIRKLLPTGMQVSAAYGLQRTKSSLSFQQINPEYFSDLALEMRQPFLRGFGIDYNRSLILLAKNDRRISDLAFERQVRDTLRNVEELYWKLVQARRNAAITARLLADYEGIYDFLDARQGFDITPVQLAATSANLEQSRYVFIQARAEVFDAEDRLTAVMNDPQINLADDVEIIPDDVPQMSKIIVDRLAEAQTALDHRPEIHEQELRVANAEIAVGRAKNQELPVFDLTFRYTIDGLSGTADSSFDEMTRHNFVEYYVGVQLEMPIGNRGPRAASRGARLRHSQAASALKSVFEEVILDVNLSTRRLSTNFDQLAPSFQAAQAREREVEAIVARAERKDLNTLNSELGAREALANARRAIVIAMVDYNIAVIDLERAKGTLLRYNNIIIPSTDQP